jgi:hypothetical protein
VSVDCVRWTLQAALARCPRLRPHAVQLERQVRAHPDLQGELPRLGPTLQRVVYEICGEHLGRELEEMGRVG